MTVRDRGTLVDVQGDGSPILFIHGFPLDRTMWRRLMSPLTGWKRIAPDLPGFGVNEAPPKAPTDHDHTTVYITKTGKKYHRDGCRYLSKSKKAISLKDAKRRYTPCKVCFAK